MVATDRCQVIYGDDVLALFKHAKDNGYAIPAVNVRSLEALDPTQMLTRAGHIFFHSRSQ